MENVTIEILNKLKELTPLFSRKYYVIRLGLFGSFAVGDYTDKSDVDIRVDFDKPIGWEFFDIEDLLYEKLDLVSMNALKKQLKDNILKQTIFV